VAAQVALAVRVLELALDVVLELEVMLKNDDEVEYELGGCLRLDEFHELV